jgi:hypothetical protein
MTPEQRRAFKAAGKLGLSTDERDLVDFAAEIMVPEITIRAGRGTSEIGV